MQDMPRVAHLLLLFLPPFIGGQWGQSPLSGSGQWGQSPSLFVSTAVQGQSLQQFVASLQQAVSRNDRAAVAGMVRYPIEVNAGLPRWLIPGAGRRPSVLTSSQLPYASMKL